MSAAFWAVVLDEYLTNLDESRGNLNRIDEIYRCVAGDGGSEVVLDQQQGTSNCIEDE